MEVFHQLLQQGTYFCSISTMHRLLRADQAQGERRAQRAAKHNAVPRLLATKPNEVWCWDITKLAARQPGKSLSLYVVIDLFSRYVLGWLLSYKENSALAEQLMHQCMQRYGIVPDQLTIHQDRGTPMTAHSYLDLMGELGATCSHSRPRVSNDNPFSQSQFRTQKYQPDYPGRFTGHDHAQQWCSDYFVWYNEVHHHSGLAGFTPQQVFTGSYHEERKVKQQAMTAHYEKHPERFVRGGPIAAMPPAFAAINPITLCKDTGLPNNAVNFPTLTAAGYQRTSLSSE
jgi:putative transposase